MGLATRAELRSKIPEGYSFARHVFWIHVFALGAIAAAIALVRDLDPDELLAVPATLVFANAVEYVFHRWPMHHDTRPLHFLFDRHTVHHHAYFRSDSMRVDEGRDMRFVLFPPLAAVAVIALDSGLGALLASALGRNVALLFCATGTSYYLAYEWCHASYHLVGERLERIPFLGAAARRHRIHHDPERMSRVNFNIPFALFDRLAGTIADT